MNHIADFNLLNAFNLLAKQSHSANRRARLAILHQPRSIAPSSITVDLPLDIRSRSRSVFGLGIVPHHFLVAEHLGHEVEIGRCHLAEEESRSFQNDLHLTIAAYLNFSSPNSFTRSRIAGSTGKRSMLLAP